MCNIISPWLYPCFYPHFTHFEHLCNWETRQSWGEYQMDIRENFDFYRIEKAITLAKK